MEALLAKATQCPVMWSQCSRVFRALFCFFLYKFMFVGILLQSFAVVGHMLNLRFYS